MKVTIIGCGLIGGSIAFALKEKVIAQSVVGVDANEQNAKDALAIGFIDQSFAIAEMKEAIADADLIVLAIPVDATEKLLPSILDAITNQQTVMDVGSTKNNICTAAKQHANGKRFVATHPMWGTEFSGPNAAVRNAFVDKAVVICNVADADADAVDMVENMYRQLGMHILQMDAAAHDMHAAYISHISHITSFALANTVLEKEKEEDAIFELASGGFESTVRLAKSNADMWVPIFQQNKEQVLDVLNEHIAQLRKFKSCLEKENYDYLRELIVNANGITRILK
jgi:prephenate dehydrogenase